MHWPQSQQEVLAFNIDLERRVQERTDELRQQVCNLRALVDALPVSVWLKDCAGRYLTVNCTHASASAHTVEQMTGKTDEDLWPGDTGRASCAADLLVISGRQRQTTEMAIPGKDGAVFWREIDRVPVTDEDGTVIGTAGVSSDITERKRAEETIALGDPDEQEPLLSKIAANFPGFLYIFRRSPDGYFNFPYVSQGIRELCGLVPSDLAKDAAPFVELIRAEDITFARERVAKSIRDMSLLDCTLMLNIPGRGECWISSNAMPRKEADGGILWYGAMLDVTKQKQINHQLELSLFALSVVHQAFSLHGIDGPFEYVNDYTCSMLGYSRDELLGLTIGDVDPDSTPEKIDAAYKTTRTEGQCIFETRLRRRDGSVFPVQITLFPFEYRGRPCFLAIASDLTNQKCAEESIAISEREFRTLADSLPDSIARYDRSGVVTYINATLGRSLTGTASDMIGKRVCEWMPDESFEGYARVLDSVLATGQDSEIEIYAPHPRVAADRACQIRMVAERNEHGEVVGVLAIGRDISVLKRSERELKESRSQLRGLIASREESIEAERKRIARDLHDDLGQILTGLQMKVSRVVRKYTVNSPELRDHVQESLALTEKALSVARDIAVAVRPSVLDMGIVAAIEWLAGQFVDNTGSKCQLHLENIDVLFDENQSIALFRMAQESLTNVARHAKASRVDVFLTAGAAESIFKIRDNGVGFDNNSTKSGSFGLLGIRERAFILGWTVSINGRLEGGGAEIMVCIPGDGIEEKI